MGSKMKVKLVSSLEKCFLDDNIDLKVEYNNGSCLKEELFRLGICYVEEEVCSTAVPLLLTVESEISDHIEVKTVQHIPVKFPVYRSSGKDDYVRTEPGLYPDLLTPVNSHNRLLLNNNLESLFVEVDTKGIDKAGVYPIKFIFSDFSSKEIISSVTFNLEIVDCVLPKQNLMFTQWFYCDCLMDYYGTKAFDERHWEIIENYMKTAVKSGINMILTPVFTPPLDTYVGGERTTTQLVDITVKGGEYEFNFDMLKRWIDMCRRLGIEYFEISHFFTQWGAEHAPKIIANVDGTEKKIFGWETDACGEEYSRFLKIFIPKLLAFLKEQGVDENCVFHISDEPTLEQLESYKAAKGVIAPKLKGYKIIDALSNYEFYESGAVLNPVPATSHIEPFLENKVPDLWAYYCCGQCNKVSNRFISMPSYRNRIIGVQLYKYGLKGFLHWGYNYYNCQFSYNTVNPYVSTDGEYFAPAGDAFSVYPAPDGTAYESLRLAVFHDALQDIRALELCENLCGRDFVMNLVEETGDGEITFSEYPRNDEYLLTLRKKVNEAIKEHKKALCQ